jgi:hypothetical protein
MCSCIRKSSLKIASVAVGISVLGGPLRRALSLASTENVHMNRITMMSVFAAAVLTQLASADVNAGNLISNGDFDNIGQVWVNNTGVGSDDWQTPGATAIPGWTNVPGFANEFWATTPNSYGLTESPGNGSVYWVDLTGQANNKPYGGIEQTITTTPGLSYVLAFDLGASTIYNSSGSGAAALTASATGLTPLASQLFTLVPINSNQWVSETLAFTADSNTTTITFLADSSFTSRYTGLDNVVVAASVPEPSGFVLGCLGALVVAAYGFRRRNFQAAMAK